MGGVYQIAGPNRFYIGSTVDLDRRRSQHFSNLRRGIHSNSHLQSAFIKYDDTSFHFSVIEVCADEDLLEREQHWINQFDWDILYNQRRVADSQLGLKWSEESRRNASIARTGLPSPMKGRHFDEKAAENIREASRKRSATKLTVQNVLDIRSSYTEKRGEKAMLAKEYNVSRQTVADVISERRWGEVV